MGVQRRYRCTKCRMRASVSGGAGAGFVVDVQTMWCASCRILRDVKVGELDETGTGPRPMRAVEPKCPRCSSGSDLKPWSFGDACPRCGGEVVATDEDVVMWD